MAFTDKELGLSNPITRRDFLNGTALAIGGALTSRMTGPAIAASTNTYPPALTGMRGQHDGSFEVMHAIRDKDFFNKAGVPQETGENYDLVVVGAGISGLTAAHLYIQQAGPNARVLILDNHDDFGGHAKRNEYPPSIV